MWSSDKPATPNPPPQPQHVVSNCQRPASEHHHQLDEDDDDSGDGQDDDGDDNDDGSGSWRTWLDPAVKVTPPSVPESQVAQIEN